MSRYRDEDDFRYSQEAHEINFMLVWECDKCGKSRSDYPGINEGGDCYCGGHWRYLGESYDIKQ